MTRALIRTPGVERRFLKGRTRIDESTKSHPPSSLTPLRFLQAMLTALPALTAGLYLLGLSWHQGYLEAFGIDDSLFPLANDKVLFTGFFSLVAFTVSSGVYAYASLGAFVILMMVVTILSSTARVQSAVDSIRAWLSRHRRKKHVPVSPRADDLLEKSAVLYGYLGGFLIVLLLLLFIVVSSSKNGREQADREMAAFKAGKGRSAQLFSPQFQSPLVGKLVICGSKHCAVWSTAGTTILKHEAIDRMVTVTLDLPVKGAAAGPASSQAGSIQ